MENFSDIQRLIPLNDVQARVPYSRVQLWRLERQGNFPRRVKLGANRIAWVEAEIDDWIADRLAQREQD